MKIPHLRYADHQKIKPIIKFVCVRDELHVITVNNWNLEQISY